MLLQTSEAMALASVSLSAQWVLGEGRVDERTGTAEDVRIGNSILSEMCQ